MQNVNSYIVKVEYKGKTGFGFLIENEYIMITDKGLRSFLFIDIDPEATIKLYTYLKF